MQRGLTRAGDEQQSRTQPRALKAIRQNQAADHHGDTCDSKESNPPSRKSPQNRDVSECCQPPPHREWMRLPSEREERDSRNYNPPAQLLPQEKRERTTADPGSKIEVGESELEDQSIRDHGDQRRETPGHPPVRRGTE